MSKNKKQQTTKYIYTVVVPVVSRSDMARVTKISSCTK